MLFKCKKIQKSSQKSPADCTRSNSHFETLGRTCRVISFNSGKSPEKEVLRKILFADDLLLVADNREELCFLHQVRGEGGTGV